jgi:alpha-D-ribose 1-methylphosphonate 5-phosphate C-P lyase
MKVIKHWEVIIFQEHSLNVNSKELRCPVCADETVYADIVLCLETHMEARETDYTASRRRHGVATL